MKVNAYIAVCVAIIVSITAGHATLTAPIPLPQAVAEASWIMHVRVKKIEEPFGDDNEYIRIGLCEVLGIIKWDISGGEILLPAADEVVKPGDKAEPFDAPETKWKTVIVSLLKRREFSPVDEGGEYIFLCRKSALIALVAGSDRIYRVDDEKVSVYASDFPAFELSTATVDIGKEASPYDRISVPLKEFLKEVRTLSETEQAGAGPPATRPESKSEGGDKPQAEAKGRTR